MQTDDKSAAVSPDTQAASLVQSLTVSDADASTLSVVESAQIQAFIDARYKAGDVKYSFVTKRGQTIDCVDFFSQGAVKALGITQLPTPPPMLVQLNAGRSRPRSDDEFNGDPDQNGNARICPAGTTPNVRMTPRAIVASGGLAKLQHALSHKAPPPSMPACAPPTGGDFALGDGGYAHVIAIAPTTAPGTVGYSSALDNMAIFAPSVGTNDHSISQTWTYAGDCTSGLGFTCSGANCVQSAEVGWTVDQAVNGAFGVSGNVPAIFTFATSDGYANGGDSCYDGEQNVGCIQWIGWPGATLSPGTALTPGSNSGGKQQEIAFQIGFASRTLFGESIPGWYLLASLNGGPFTTMGVYPATDFTGAMASGNATHFQVGGEVFDANQGWTVPMGSGSDPIGGFGFAGYHYNYEACIKNVETEDCYSNFPMTVSQAGPTNVQASYGWSSGQSGAPSGGSGTGVWDNWFYYGDSPHLFWNENYGYNWSPRNPPDWDNGFYKAECQIGLPVLGVSETTNQTPAQAIQCGATSLATTGSGCYFRPATTITGLGHADQCDTDNGWDWDPNSYKDECCAGEFVSGVAQSTSGNLSGVLCCPGAVNHRTCQAYVIDSSNTGFQWPDWDYGALKAQCAANQYVAGISSPSAGHGTVGAVHAILCCNP